MVLYSYSQCRYYMVLLNRTLCKKHNKYIEVESAPYVTKFGALLAAVSALH